MGDLSPHFSRREFACPCCGWDNIHPSVIAMLEQNCYSCGAEMQTQEKEK